MTNLTIWKLFAFPHSVASPKEMTQTMRKFYDIPVMHLAIRATLAWHNSDQNTDIRLD